MKNKLVKRLFAVVLSCAMVVLSACGSDETGNVAGSGMAEGSTVGESSESASNSGQLNDGFEVNSVANGENATPVAVLDVADMFSDRDLKGEYKAQEGVKIELTGDSAMCNSKAVQVSGNTITITGEGTYILSGTLKNGSVVVAADNEKAKVQLVLAGAEIHNDTGAAIYVKSCDKIFVTMAENSENSLSNGGSYESIDENNIDGAVFSKSDICFNGTGSLTISANAGHGVVTKDDLKITGGNITVNAVEGHGFSGKDSVRIASGNLVITSGKDGIHAENAEDTAKGYIYIGGGDLDIISGGDGIAASGIVQVDTVDLNIQAGGGHTNKITATDGNGDTLSTKGIKASSDVILNDGTFIINSQDDALHSDMNLTVNGGTYELTTGDDGLHADEATAIAGGTINIVKSYEGIEGNKVYVSGGYIKMVASDDGINAAGGNDGGMGGFFGGDHFGGSTDSTVEITGGTLYMNAAGDGLDSNGSLIVTGGEVYLSGPTNGANGALDYTTTGQAAGGTVVALGNAQMAMNFDDSSTQGSVLLTASGNASAGSEIIVKDAEGNVLIEYQAESAFNSVLITSPKLQVGETYTFSIAGSELEMTLETLINGSGNGMGGPGGHGGMGNPGGMPGGMGGHGGRPGGR